MRLFTLFALLLCQFTARAQEPAKYELAPCGTPPGITPWLRTYSGRPQDFTFERSGDTLYAAIQVHLVAKDNGSGRISPDKLLDAFCRLNSDFAPARVRFYFKNDWNLIDSTGWHQHQTIPQGIDMMLANNVSGALNSYFASNVAGNCGYNLPYAGVAVAHGCAGPNDHTWTHEVGHALSLPHPFIGWEGKAYGSINPTPDTLTYDYTHFHDSLETVVPAPLDTALVEYLNGSNCAIAADLICDTKADYLSYRWDCDAQNNSLVQQKDPSGAAFYSDGTLYMSYSFDNCQNRFSDEQVAILRANLLSEKAEWLTTASPAADITELPTLLYPIGGQLAPQNGAVLQWTAVPHATRYVVQVSRFSSFLVKEVDQVVTGTSYTTEDLLNNLTYYWRVRPFNDWYACTELTAAASFKTADIVSAPEPDAGGWRCYPTLLSPGQPLTVEMPPARLNHFVRCSVYDAAGRAVWQTETIPGTAIWQIQLPSADWAPGMYRVVLSDEKTVKKFPVLLYR